MAFQDCINIIREAAGRVLNDDEVEGIYNRIGFAVRKIKQDNQAAGLQMSPEDILRKAAAEAAQNLVADAELKKVRTALTILAHDRNTKAMQAHPRGYMQGLLSLMVKDARDSGTVQSAESRKNAVQKEAFSRMLDTLTATEPRFFGLIENQEGVVALVREMHGMDSGNPVAKRGAQVWLETAEALRQRFNRAGGDIGKLEDWALPHHHSQERVLKAGKERWIADILPKLDREKYVNPDGSLFTDGEVVELLSQAWDTIATGGLNKVHPEMAGHGGSMRANWHAEHRQIHFKDADSWLAYQDGYGDRSLYGVLTGHVETMARDIALIETFGPNPDNQFKVLHELARASGASDGLILNTRHVYDELAGKTSWAQHPTFARYAQGMRNLISAARLGRAVISSVTDFWSVRQTAHVWNIPAMKLVRQQLKAFNPRDAAERARAQRLGLGLDTLLSELNRWGEGQLGGGWTSRMATLTLRASGLSAMTEANKRAYGVVMMSTIGKLVQETADYRSLPDARLLKSKGILPRDWEVWRMAQQEKWGDVDMLTPEAIRAIPDATIEARFPGESAQHLRDEAVTRYLGMVLEETDIAVPTAGVAEYAVIRQGTQKGTPLGELSRSIFQFKSFPIAIIRKHWMRGMGMPTVGGKAGYIASFVAGSAVLGGIAAQLKDISDGKDPADMEDPRFMLRAMVQGGGLGLYGDFLLSETTRYGNSAIATLMGPTFGMAEDLDKLVRGNLVESIQGKDTHAGAEVLKFAKGATPLINLWYTRAALDHMVLHELQEYMSPGYLRRVKDRTRDEFGQEYWWEPGEALPDRAPALEAAAGG